jgi:hypothetical protein
LKTPFSTAMCFGVLLVLAVALSCGGDDTAAGGEAVGCSINSECNNPLVCAFRKCHKQCSTARDCPTGQRCVLSTDADTGEILGKVCQLPEEATKQCTRNSDCPGVQICGIDSKCRDECIDARDCPLRTQLCINSTCADPEETKDGGLPQTNDASVTRDGDPINPTTTGGGMGGSGMGGMGGMGGSGMGGATGGTGGGAGGGAPDAGNDVSMGGSAGTGGTGGGMPDAGRDVSVGPCGHSGEPCCTTGQPCTLGYSCNASQMCVTCGGKGQPCCGTSCTDPNLDCVANTCQCGDSNQVCCGGTMCNSGLTCSMPDSGGRSSCACGGNQQACCPGMTCKSASLKCAGLRCSCITACSGDRTSGSEIHVLRSDGTVWYYPNYYTLPTVVADSSMIPVTGFTKVSTSQGYACGIKSDKTLWCWTNANNNTTMHSYGELGNASNAASKAPVQVLKGLGGPALANAIDISTFGSNACAVVDEGDADPANDTVWCWGYGYYGQLGNGVTPAPQYSNYAQQVVLSLLGSPLSNINQVSVGSNYVCAHQRSTQGGEGSIWCWGYNGYGTLGVGDKMNTNVPKQVTTLLDGATQVAASTYITCARTGPDVWCWGYAGNMVGVGDGTPGDKTTPVRVLVAAGGAPFTGVADLKASATGPCALRSADNSVWCWYNNYSVAHPTPVSPAGFPLTSVAYWDDYGSQYICFARTDADLYLHAQKPTYPVACPP